MNNINDLEKNLGFLVHDVARLMRKAFDRRASALGLTRAQWFVLAEVYRTDGQTQTELSDAVEMEKAPLGKVLDRLEAGGWITRRPDKKDRRANRVYITDKIGGHIEHLRATTTQLYDDTLEGFSEVEREQIIQFLLRARQNLADIEKKRDPYKQTA